MNHSSKKNQAKYLIVSCIIIALAILSRFVFLGDKPLHHDEGMLSYFAWRLSHFGDYIYTPQIHSPILFYVQAIFYLILGVSDTVSKVGPAVFGVALVSIPLFFHQILSKRTAIFISLGFLISPITLYYSRFLVHTSMVIVFWLLAVLFIYKYFKDRKVIGLYLSSVFLSFAFGTSETSYIFIAVAGFYLMILILFLSRKNDLFKKLKEIVFNNYLDFITLSLIFILIWTAIYSVGFTNPESLHRSLPLPNDASTSLGFWLAQHPKKLGGQLWHYYIVLALVYETIFVFGTLGFIYKFIFGKKSAFKLFILIWFLGTIAVYSWAGEKFPWLFLPSLLPMIFATGLFLGGSWNKFKVPFKIFWVIVGLWTGFVAIRLVYVSPAETKELAVYVQTPPSFQTIIEEVRDKCDGTGDKNCVLIDSKISWPLSWSFRDFSTLIVTENYSIQPTTKYLIVGSESHSSMQKPLDMSERTAWIRDWWVPERCRGGDCLEKYLKYYFLRKTWNEKGGYHVHIYSRI